MPILSCVSRSFKETLQKELDRKEVELVFENIKKSKCFSVLKLMTAQMASQSVISTSPLEARDKAIPSFRLKSCCSCHCGLYTTIPLGWWVGDMEYSDTLGISLDQFYGLELGLEAETQIISVSDSVLILSLRKIQSRPRS